MVATPISCNLWLYPRTLNELSATYLQTLWEAHTLVSVPGSQKPQGCWAINNTAIPDSRKSGLRPTHLSSERRATFSAFTRACGKGLWTSRALGSSGSAISPVGFTFLSSGCALVKSKFSLGAACECWMLLPPPQGGQRRSQIRHNNKNQCFHFLIFV